MATLISITRGSRAFTRVKVSSQLIDLYVERPQNIVYSLYEPCFSVSSLMTTHQQIIPRRVLPRLPVPRARVPSAVSATNMTHSAVALAAALGSINVGVPTQALITRGLRASRHAQVSSQIIDNRVERPPNIV